MPPELRLANINQQDDPEKKNHLLKQRREKIKEDKESASTIQMTLQDIAGELWMALGSLSKAARVIGCSRYALYHKIQGAPFLLHVMDEIKEFKLDFTEEKLMEAIGDGNVTAMTLYLKTIGKERGYVERSQVEHDATGFKNGADLIRAMREGMEGVGEDAPEVEEAPEEDGSTTIELEGYSWSHLPESSQDQSS